MAKKRGNGEGTVWHNAKRGRWEAQYVVGTKEDGTPIRRRVTGRTRALVVEKLREAQAAAKHGETRARADLSVSRFLDDWLTYAVPGTVRPSTERQYRDVVRLYINPHVGRKKLATLSARDVSAMLKALRDAGKAPNTQRLARSVLRRALRWAEHDGLVARNVAAVTDGVKVGKIEGRTMTVAEAQQLVASLDEHRLAAAWIMLLHTGMRRGELLGLCWDDLVLDGPAPTAKIRRTLQRVPNPDPSRRTSDLAFQDPKTDGSARTVQLSGTVVAAMKRHKTQQAAERLHAGPEWERRPLGADLVFRNHFGGPVDPDNFRHMTNEVTIAAGIGRWTPHELRHTAASLLIAEGVPLKMISESLGHSSIRMTADVYGHLLDESRAETANAMDRIFGA